MEEHRERISAATQLRRFGGTIGCRLVSYPTYATLDRPDPSDDRRLPRRHST